MKAFFRFFAERHLLANLLTIMILLLGVISLTRINLSELPKVDVGQVVITTRYPGASPEDVELNVTNKIEDELRSVTGIDWIRSSSFENSSIVSVKIDDDADLEDVQTEIREAVAQVTDFPAEVTESPKVTEIKSSIFPIIEVGMSSDELSYRELREYARQFEKKLKEISGVASVEKYGYRAREIKVEVNPDKMMKYQLPMRDIINAIQARNIRASGGSLESYTSEKNVVTLAQFRDPLEVGDVIIRSTFEGAMIWVKDLAVIRDDFEEERLIPSMNGKKTISFQLTKSENADVIETVDAIKELVKKEKAHLPETIEFLYSDDISINVRNSFEVVGSNGLVGLGLVGVVVNDSLVLVDHLNELKRKEKDKPLAELVAFGTANRLRPILLTTFTTVAGLLPLAYGLGGESVDMAPMGLALGYGLLFATPITLILNPLPVPDRQ